MNAGREFIEDEAATAAKNTGAEKLLVDLREEMFEVAVNMRIDWPEFCRQRAYVTNEAANKKGSEGETLEGLVSLLDHIADTICDANPDRVDELMAWSEAAYQESGK